MDDSSADLTKEQSRAGRGLLNWTQADLGSRAGLSEGTVRHFESGLRTPSAESLVALRKAMEAAGIKFIPGNGEGPGVRIAKGSSKHGAADLPVLKAKKRAKAKSK